MRSFVIICFFLLFSKPILSQPFSIGTGYNCNFSVYKSDSEKWRQFHGLSINASFENKDFYLGLNFEWNQRKFDLSYQTLGNLVDEWQSGNGSYYHEYLGYKADFNAVQNLLNPVVESGLRMKINESVYLIPKGVFGMSFELSRNIKSDTLWSVRTNQSYDAIADQSITVTESTALIYTENAVIPKTNLFFGLGAILKVKLKSSFFLDITLDYRKYKKNVIEQSEFYGANEFITGVKVYYQFKAKEDQPVE